MKNFFTFLTFLFSFALYAQNEGLKPESEYDRVLTYSQMWEEIINCEDTVYLLENALVKYDDNSALYFEKIKKNSIVIKPEITWSNIYFENLEIDPWDETVSIYLENLKFQRNFSIFDIKNVSDVEFVKCNFRQGVFISHNNGMLSTWFVNTEIHKRFSINGFHNTESQISIGINRCLLDITGAHIYCGSIKRLKIEKSEIKTSDSNAFKISGKFKLFDIDSCSFLSTLITKNIEVIDKFHITNSKFNNIDFNEIILPSPYNVKAKWSQLSKNLVISKNKRKGKTIFTTRFLCSGIKNLDYANEEQFDDLFSNYNQFFQIYKSRGDLVSANSCYIEMKDLQTQRLKYIHQVNPTLKTYLNYQLNVFLKFFALYGTDPVRSIQISIYVILIFAFFYLFFYSEWDRINREFLISKSEILLSYFSSEQKLEELYSDNYKIEMNTFKHFKKNIQDSQAHVPFFFLLFLKPLYWGAVIKHKWKQQLYKRIEFLQGKWTDLTAKKKFVLGSFTFIALVSYTIYLVVIKSLNSLILSINAFTTLGFGDIPVKGISRYIAILEGFLGWFLLSIFSVSLISQILQN